MRAIFSIPKKVIPLLFRADRQPPHYLAYVEWFTPFKRTPHPHSLLHQVKRSYHNGDRLASVIPLQNIRRSAHLFPWFGKKKPSAWTSNNVLDLCDTFLLNIFSDCHAFHTMI